VFAGIAVLAACGGTLHAQQLPTPPPMAAEPQAPEAQQPPSPQAAPATSGKQTPDSRRDDIRMMESVLTQALQKGAQDLARLLRVNQPNSAFVTGTGRARGFVLEGYGMFFDVDVPGMRQSVVWSEQMVQLMQDRERAAQDLARLSPADPLRKVAEMQYRTIERLIAAAQTGQVLIPSPAPPTQLAQPGTVNAQNISGVSETVITAAPNASNAAADAARVVAAPAPSSVSPSAVARDPNELYTESVKNALIDAMLKYSAFLKIGDTEWLTVAASDSEGPPVQGQLDDTSRLVIRVKGADLTAFQAGKLTRDEVLKKVEVREY
jgi:hypothetical protein